LCEGETNSEGIHDKDEEITRRRKPNKKGMYEKTPVDGIFLAIQTRAYIGQTKERGR
jgi:hypothetical protein